MNPAFQKSSQGADQHMVAPAELRPVHSPMTPPPAFSPHERASPMYSPPPQEYSSPQPKGEYNQGYFPQQQSPHVQQQASGPGFKSAVPIANLGMSSAPVDCPGCGERAMTSISYHAGNTAHAWGLGLCLLTGILCFIPYLMNSMKDVEHRCSRCGRLLATWHKSGKVDVHAYA